MASDNSGSSQPGSRPDSAIVTTQPAPRKQLSYTQSHNEMRSVLRGEVRAIELNINTRV